MQSIKSLINQLQTDYPRIVFEQAQEFWWSAERGVIYYDPLASNSIAYSLHELSHALLQHKGYEKDIDLIKLERDAWSYAVGTLATRYGHKIDNELVQDNLDTYRTWLHARSSCPECEATGLQNGSQQYRCLACDYRWRVNEARLCALRRYSLQTK